MSAERANASNCLRKTSEGDKLASVFCFYALDCLAASRALLFREVLPGSCFDLRGSAIQPISDIARQKPETPFGNSANSQVPPFDFHF